MKRIIAFILAVTMLFAVSACGGGETKPESKPEKEVDVIAPEKEPYEENEPPADPPVKAPADKPADVPSDKPADMPPAPPADKPADVPSDKPSDVPSAPPADKPADAPSDKPADVPPAPPAASGTVGDALAGDFRANASKSGQEIADAVIKNSVIPEELVLMTMEVEEGYLTGFDNTEIKGFENGVMFAPGMGTIPFVGYIFTLPAGADVDAFVKTLKDGANLRWNICTEAEQMVVEKSGNKVFFVMCPKSFEQ